MPWTSEARREEKGEHAQYMTTGELAHFLGVRKKTVMNWCRNGRLPEPDALSPSGWKLWSPDACTAILQAYRLHGLRHPWS